MEKEKGCSTAYLDSSPTIITAFTELGGAEPLVEVLKGCEELSLCTVFCPKQLHVSQYNTLWWHIVKPLKPDQELDKLPTTQSVWLEHTRRSQVQAWPSFVSSAISIGCVLTLVIFGTIAQFGADKTVSVARAPA